MTRIQRLRRTGTCVPALLLSRLPDGVVLRARGDEFGTDVQNPRSCRVQEVECARPPGADDEGTCAVCTLGLFDDEMLPASGAGHGLVCYPEHVSCGHLFHAACLRAACEEGVDDEELSERGASPAVCPVCRFGEPPASYFETRVAAAPATPSLRADLLRRGGFTRWVLQRGALAAPVRLRTRTWELLGADGAPARARAYSAEVAATPLAAGTRFCLEAEGGSAAYPFVQLLAPFDVDPGWPEPDAAGRRRRGALAAGVTPLEAALGPAGAQTTPWLLRRVAGALHVGELPGGCPWAPDEVGGAELALRWTAWDVPFSADAADDGRRELDVLPLVPVAEARTALERDGQGLWSGCGAAAAAPAESAGALRLELLELLHDGRVCAFALGAPKAPGPDGSVCVPLARSGDRPGADRPGADPADPDLIARLWPATGRAALAGCGRGPELGVACRLARAGASLAPDAPWRVACGPELVRACLRDEPEAWSAARALWAARPPSPLGEGLHSPEAHVALALGLVRHMAADAQPGGAAGAADWHVPALARRAVRSCAFLGDVATFALLLSPPATAPLGAHARVAELQAAVRAVAFSEDFLASFFCYGRQVRGFLRRLCDLRDATRPRAQPFRFRTADGVCAPHLLIRRGLGGAAADLYRRALADWGDRDAETGQSAVFAGAAHLPDAAAAESLMELHRAAEDTGDLPAWRAAALAPGRAGPGAEPETAAQFATRLGKTRSADFLRGAGAA